MSIKSTVHYDESKDRVEGFENFGQEINSVVANQATVFMVKGITAKWKQSSGYFFTSGAIKGDKLKTLIIEAIQHISNQGLTCLAVICDQGFNNSKALRQLGVTVDQPFFHVDSVQVHVLYDPPHILKNTRNNLFKYGYKLDNVEISWDIIRETYEIDQKHHLSLCPK